jgi:hypothetical protein
MRAIASLLVGLAFIPVACSSNSGTAPPTFDKELLRGKWKNSSESQIVAGYEFAADGTLKVSILAMDQPLTGRYSWSGDRTLDLEYKLAAEVAQAYEAAAKAYKDDVNARIKAGKLSDRAGPSILGAVQDKWPASESFTAAISDQGKLLILNRPNGGSQSFEKAE